MQSDEKVAARRTLGYPDPMRVAILTTGGTIEKRYDEADGSLRNRESPLAEILRGLRLPDLEYQHFSIMSKDSLEMTDEDRAVILHSVADAILTADAVIVLHGTDTLAKTGEVLHQGLRDLRIPVILTGAMRPFEFRDTDAFQNMTEALLACRLASPGVYVAMHNKVLRFPGVEKDRA